MKKRYELKVKGLTHEGFISLMDSIEKMADITAFCFNTREVESFIRFETYDVQYSLKELNSKGE